MTNINIEMSATKAYSDFYNYEASQQGVHKTWCFTLNNYTEEEVNTVKSLEYNYCVFGFEVGEETGTPHLQGCITFKHGKRLSAVSKYLKRAYWAKCMNFEGAANYCMKGGDFWLQDKRKQGKRNDLEQACAVLKESGLKGLAMTMPATYVKYPSGFTQLAAFYREPRTEKPYVEWIWGPTGVGKSTSLLKKYGPINSWFKKDNRPFWNGYENQEVIVFDDLRADWWPFEYLLGILDCTPMNVDVKNGWRYINSPKIYITAPCGPAKMFDHLKDKEDLQQLFRRIDKVTYMGPL